MSFLREPDAEPIPGYRLIEPLGSGGFGEVWKCEAPGGIFKAIKFVYGNLNSLDSEGVRAEQELHALQRIKEVRHPFVLSLDRIEIVSGELVIVMELADKSLHDVGQECQVAGLVGVPRDALLRYIRDTAEALDHMLEKHNLLHLDVKPRNLFVISDRVKVADFGLVKHLGRSDASGILGGVTPLYAPPETFNNQISPQSDQYSLAIVYQELLTGQRPFNGKNARQLAMQHMKEEPELRLLPEAERPVVARALAKDPGKRFPNCMAFVRALYLARNQSVRPELIQEAAPGNRPKTMADTMEDIFLENLPEPDAPPAPSPVMEGEEISQLGITVAQPQTGVLRPTLIIGIGGFGRRALMDLRCRFIDRFGELSNIPMMRFLYVDTDPDAPRLAARGAPEVALSTNEVCNLPLQPPSNYRRRMLEQLTDWLPREKLYGVPRSLQTQGSRALGRLAFTDNHLRFLARLRREMQQAAHPDALYQSVSQTGLALRDNTPRIHVIVSAGGGGSGMLVDLGYSLRRLLHQMRHTNAEITVFVFCGAPSDPATPPQEQANVYATLTELNHFFDSAIQFAAQYGVDGPRIVDASAPFNNVYLIQAAHRGPETLRDAIAHLSSYIFHDVTTGLGLRLDRSRRVQPSLNATPFRSFGTFAVWFPRGLLLRLGARQACARLLEEWQAVSEEEDSAELEAACARALADPGLRFEAVCASIEESAQIPSEGLPAEALTALLSHLEEQSQQMIALEDPGSWAKQALSRVRDWIGVSLQAETESGWRRSRLGRSFSTAIQQVALTWEEKLTEVAFGLMEHPGRRVAEAEAALTRFIQFCQDAVANQHARFEQQVQKTHLAWEHLDTALQRCVVGPTGFSFFMGGRTRRLLRVFIDHLAAYTRQRLAEDITGAGLQFYAALQGKLEERLRDLTFCRQRLRNLQEGFEAPSDEAFNLLSQGTPLDGNRSLSDSGSWMSPPPSTESFWDNIRQSATVRVVLPDGETDLERAASRFISGLTPEQWTQLDQALQDRVLTVLGGLHHVCMTSGDLLRNLARPLIEEAAHCLSDLLPITDVAEVELADISDEDDLAARARACLAQAAPLVAGKDTAQQHSFLLAPASEAGKRFSEDVKELMPDVHMVRVPGQADLMFCREQGYLSIEDIQRLLHPCQAAYENTAMVPSVSPHSRFDITDWSPLDT
ncbi:MAG: tubulin-like doman-containing protein [Gemmataceae bacterium]